MPHRDGLALPTRLRLAAPAVAGAVGTRAIATHARPGAVGTRAIATRPAPGLARGAALPDSHATGVPQGPLPLRLAAPNWRAEASPARMPAPLVHAAPPLRGPGAGPARAGAPAALRPLEAIAATLPRETVVDHAGRGAVRPGAPRPAQSPPPELRVIADRVYEVLVDRMRQERRARGL